MNNNQKAFIAMGLMVALAFVVVGASSFIASASAAPPQGVPPSTPPGAGVSSCAKAAQAAGQDPSECRPSRP